MSPWEFLYALSMVVVQYDTVPLQESTVEYVQGGGLGLCRASIL